MEIHVIENQTDRKYLLKNIADFRASLLIQHMKEMPYSSEKKKELLENVMNVLKKSDSNNMK